MSGKLKATLTALVVSVSLWTGYVICAMHAMHRSEHAMHRAESPQKVSEIKQLAQRAYEVGFIDGSNNEPKGVREHDETVQVDSIMEAAGDLTNPTGEEK